MVVDGDGDGDGFADAPRTPIPQGAATQARSSCQPLGSGTLALERDTQRSPLELVLSPRS